MTSVGPRLAPLALLTSLGVACTVFDGLEAHEASRGGAGGAGAGGEGPLAERLLPNVNDAMHVCSLVARCPTLGPSLVRSLALPVVGIAPEGGSILRTSACLEWLHAPLLAGRRGAALATDLLACVAATSTCSDALACVFVEDLAPQGDASRCEGDRALDCGARAELRCGSARWAGLSQCEAFDDGGATRVRCALGGCDSFDGVTCGEDASGAPSIAARCLEPEGLREGLACGAAGLSCVAGDEATSGCVADEAGAASCDELGASSCSLDVARVCDGVLRGALDCAASGRGCVELGTEVRCARPSETCSPFDPDVDVCVSETVLRVCLDGDPLEYDCATLGQRCEGPGMAGALSGRCELP
jgi:hypothetical protein